jgi:hypothetical protein
MFRKQDASSPTIGRNGHLAQGSGRLLGPELTSVAADEYRTLEEAVGRC